MNRERVIQYITSMALLVGLWQLVVLVFSVPSFILPSPATVILTLWTDRRLISSAAIFTISNAFLGAAAGCSLGLIIALSCALSPKLRWIFMPYLSIFQSFPRESLFPVFVLWFGFGALTKILNATLLSMLPMAVISLNGLLDTRPEYLQLIRGWGASHWQEILYCRLPNAIPQVVGALRVCIPLAMIGSVLGEFIGGNEGLGHLILSSGAAFRSDRVFASVVVLAVLGTSLVELISLLQRRMLKKFSSE
jgi:putative hydroxymethylpyrimidine transport system permease protein